MYLPGHKCEEPKYSKRITAGRRAARLDDRWMTYYASCLNIEHSDPRAATLCVEACIESHVTELECKTMAVSLNEFHCILQPYTSLHDCIL